MDLHVKDPDSVEPFSLDWTADLTAIDDGATIDTSAWFVEGNESPVDLTVDVHAVEDGELETSLTLSGGTDGLVYTVTNRITTAGSPSYTLDKSFLIRVEHK